jgi:hypothetical protein
LHADEVNCRGGRVRARNDSIIFTMESTHRAFQCWVSPSIRRRPLALLRRCCCRRLVPRGHELHSPRQCEDVVLVLLTPTVVYEEATLAAEPACAALAEKGCGRWCWSYFVHETVVRVEAS